MASSHLIQHQSKKKNLGLYILGALVLIAAILGILEATNTTYFFHKKPSAVSRISSSPDTMGSNTGNNQKGEPTNTISSSNTAASGHSQPGDNKSDTGGTSSQVLLAPDPSDGFVSNHHPNLSGHPAPSTLTSVCTTTPGASCVITFTQNGITKSLPTQTTDRGGSAYWNDWTLQSIGLTTGSWQVKAIATFDGQTKSAIDAMNLVVSP